VYVCMYVCMYVCVCVCACVHVCARVCVSPLRKLAHARARLCVHWHVRAFVHVCVVSSTLLVFCLVLTVRHAKRKAP
jgi:hypothetical protein